jgi:glycosyltransferase involved in cell wall biosynthesis
MNFSLLSVLMPIYNERATLERIVSRVFASPVGAAIELIAVDDGSDDDSWELLSQLAAVEPRIHPLRQPRNIGKGAAVRRALESARGEVVVIQDADLEYDPADYPRLLAPILANEADAVFGSRFAAGQRTRIGLASRLANRVLTSVANRVAGQKLTDMETGLKMICTDVIRGLKLTSDTFAIEPELTVQLARAGARIREIPISYRARNYADGKKIRSHDFFKALHVLLARRQR